MAYRKKPQFGGATMFIENLNTSLGKHLVQKKSIILINDKKIKPKKFDVDYLYKNSMRSIK